jgi:hypothetical protein
MRCPTIVTRGAALVILILGMASNRTLAQPAPKECASVALGPQAMHIVDVLADTRGAGVSPIGAFIDGERLFVLMPGGAMVVVPPDIADVYLGRVTAARTVALMFKAPSEPEGRKAPRQPVWRLENLTIVRAPPVIDALQFESDSSSYTFLATSPGRLGSSCPDPQLTILPSQNGIAVRSTTALTIETVGSEAIVTPDHGSPILLSGCCQTPPSLVDTDPRLAFDQTEFQRQIESDRFFRGDFRRDWTPAAADAFRMIKRGDLEEAKQSLALVRRRIGDEVSPIVTFLNDLIRIADPPDTETTPLPPPTVRESAARLRAAREVISACRRHDFTKLAGRRISFAEVLPPAASMPPRIAAAAARCEAEYLLAIGEIREGLSRLRGPEWRVGSETEDIRYLLLNTLLLERASQDDLAEFARRRLGAALQNSLASVDLRPYDRYFQFDRMFGPEAVFRHVVERRLSFGDDRIDAEALAQAVNDAPISVLVRQLPALTQLRDRLADPALTGFVQRRLVSRIVTALAPRSTDALAPTDKLELTSGLRTMEADALLADRLPAIRVSIARALLELGLADDAGGILAELLAQPVTEDIVRATVPELLETYFRLKGALLGRPAFDDPLWKLTVADPLVSSAVASTRERLETEVVRGALTGSVDPGSAPAESTLRERIHRLELTQ